MGVKGENENRTSYSGGLCGLESRRREQQGVRQNTLKANNRSTSGIGGRAGADHLVTAKKRDLQGGGTRRGPKKKKKKKKRSAKGGEGRNERIGKLSGLKGGRGADFSKAKPEEENRSQIKRSWARKVIWG